MSRDHRRLAAIMLADLVGYSRLMEADEASTLSRLKAAHKEVFEPAIAEFGGRIVKTTGDGTLCEFPSAVDAVECAVEMQNAMAERGAGEPADTRLLFRVGINLGDIIVDGDDIFGDGVNVAARLESLAAAGGLCISGTAHDTLRGALADNFTNDGEQNVKNIRRPIRIFSWKPDGMAVEPAAGAGSTAGHKPTVALGAFDPVGSEPETESLAAAVRDAVQASMSNLTGMTALSDPLQADYVLSASFQTRNGRYRATALLRDRQTGKQFWSERFDGESVDRFEAEDELAARISGASRVAMYIHTFEKHGGNPAEEADSQTLLSQAGFLVIGTDPDQWLQARAMTEKVIEYEPENFMAWAINSVSYLYEPLNGYRRASPEDLAAAGESGRRAVRLNGQSDFAHAMLGTVNIFEGDLAGARRAAERSLELNPYSPMGGFLLGQTMIYGGAPEEGIARALEAAEIVKRAPMYHATLYFVALGNFVCGRYEDAVRWAERAQLQVPGLPQSLIVMTSAAASDGDMEGAKSYADRLLAAHPEFSLATLGRMPFSDPEPWNRLVNGLRNAGLPE